MQIEVTMPRMGQGMEQGTILQWLKPIGAQVKRGEPLIEIESDKATVEIEAFASGRLANILIQAGETASIGAVLGYIEAEETVPISANPQQSTPISANLQQSTPTPETPQRRVSPVAQRLAQHHQIDLNTVVGTGRGGRITRENVERARVPAQVAPSRLDVSPLARRLARENGLDLYKIVGSAPNGRIIKRDILATLAANPSQPTTTPTKRLTLSKIRRAAAARMTESKSTIPHFYLTLDIEMERALLLRESLKKRGKTISVNDLILKASALALKEYPTLNATLDGDDLILNDAINLAIAVTLGERQHPDGLITPIIHGCESLKLVEIAERAAAVAERARTSKLKVDDLSGGTFTVSNLGMFGIRQFTAIINPPQVAILAVGAIQKLVVFDEQDRVKPAQRLTVTLSADHRVTDGAEAAGFLAVLKDVLEDGFVLAE